MNTKPSGKRVANLTKAAFVERISHEFDITKVMSADVLDFMVDTIKQHLTKGGGLTMAGFGTFKVVRRAARGGKNPRTGESIKIKASKTVRFRPAPSFRNDLR